MVKTQPLAGRPVPDAIHRALGAARTSLEVDLAASDHYERRVATAHAQRRLDPSGTPRE